MFLYNSNWDLVEDGGEGQIAFFEAPEKMLRNAQSATEATIETTTKRMPKTLYQFFSLFQNYKMKYEPYFRMQAMPLRDHVSGLLIPKERKYCIKAVIVKHNDDGTVLYTPLAFGEEQIKGLDKATYDDKNDVYYMYVRSKFSQAGAALNALYFRHIASWVTAAFALLFILSVLAQSIRFSKQERLRQKEKSDLLISVAHELKTPMGTTSLYAEKIDRSESLEQAQQATLSLQREVLLMRDRLSDLLTFSKIDGKAVLRKTSFDLGDLLEDVSDEYVPQMEDKGIAFNIASHPEINVCADRTRIRMALSN